MVSGNVWRHLLVATWGHLPAHLYVVVCGQLVVGGDTTRLPEHAPEEVALSTLPQALLTVTGQCAFAAQVGLAMSLRLVMPSLPLP
jgi:hypothetical protein